MEYNKLSKEAKQVVIDLATEAGYGHPEYTNFEEIDYKFFEDFPHKESVFILAEKLANSLGINWKYPSKNELPKQNQYVIAVTTGDPHTS